MHANVLRKWMRDAAVDLQHAFSGQGLMKPKHAELDRLRKETEKLNIEHGLLKKAAVYSAKELMWIRLHCETQKDLISGRKGYFDCIHVSLGRRLGRRPRAPSQATFSLPCKPQFSFLSSCPGEPPGRL